jgi:hypothetical protein
MKFGFDLDGTLDKPALRDLANILISAGHEVHVITGTFPEAGDWQNADAKMAKMRRLGIPFTQGFYDPLVRVAQLHILYAVNQEYPRDYRLADLGLRKGALCETLGLTMIFDDSMTYCEMIPKMAGNTVVLQVR